MILNKIVISSGLIILIAAYPVYLWATYIDEVITEGDAYGFQIGESKREVYGKLSRELKSIVEHGESIFIEIKSTSDIEEYVATKKDHSVMIRPSFHGVGFSKFRMKNQWDFYVGGSYFNSLKLNFCDDKLCRIYRHRKYFEII